jgi:hypothetical protein
MIHILLERYTFPMREDNSASIYHKHQLYKKDKL